MTPIDVESNDDQTEDQRPRQQSLGGVLRREGNWRCLVLSALLAGCLAAAAWCRLAQVQRVVINFSVYPIKRTRQMSPCDDGYMYIPVAFMGLLYLVYLVECFHCTARLQLAHRVDVSAVADRVRAMRLARPKVWWKAVCYHYVRRKRQVTRYRNGDAYTTTQVYYERVNSHSASATFAHAYCGFKDVSRNLVLDSRGPITKIRFSKGFAFSNIEAAGEFEDQRSRFFAEHERFDDYMEMREGLDLVGVSSFKEYMVAYRDTDRLPWYSSHALFWVLSCLLLSWPLRILIECNTAYVHYTVTKIFGVNYDIDNSRRLDLETHMSHYTPPVSGNQITRLPPSNPILYSQTATLANQNASLDSDGTSSNQHINILALARSRNGMDSIGAMSHTSTIDSLELFATIRENCALVPSYSEALLLSSLGVCETSTEDILLANSEGAVLIANGQEQGVSDVTNRLNKVINNLSLQNTVLNSLENSNASDIQELENDKSTIGDIILIRSPYKGTGSSLVSQPCTSSRDINFINDNCDLENPRSAIKPANNLERQENQSCSPSAILNNNIVTPRKRLRILEEFNIMTDINSSDTDDCSTDDRNIVSERTTTNRKYSLKMQTTQSNYSLKTNNNNSIFTERDSTNHMERNKAQNRKSWAGFLSKPSNTTLGNNCRGHSSARVRPIPLLNCRRNSLTEALIKQSDDALREDNTNTENACPIANNHIVSCEIEDEEESIPIAQIEAIDRNLLVQSNPETPNRQLYFASPLLEICPNDPFGGRVQTTPTEDPPPYEVAVNLPVLRRITRSVTDRGELFGQSRAFISDTFLNRRSCVDNVVSGTDAVRLIESSITPRGRTQLDMETNL